jgi:lipopolysaccharide transport system permease protein
MASGQSDVIRIGATPRFSWLSPRELWAHRDLIYLLARRDVAIKYKQTAVGAVWAVLQPLLLAVVFAAFFGALADVPSENGVEYPVFALSGLVMWLFVTTAVTRSATSTVSNSELISKVYFPRAILPIAAVLAPLVDLAVALLVVIVVAFAFGEVPPPRVFLLPIPVALAVTVALGAGLWLSALYVRYRDVAYLVPFLILVGLAMTPIVYPFDLVPDHLQPIYALNPMVGVFELYRWMLFSGSPWPGSILLIPIGVSVLLIVSGYWYFQRAQMRFADVI